MADLFASNQQPTYGTGGNPRSRTLTLQLLRVGLYSALVIAVAIIAVAAYQAMRASTSLHAAQERTVAGFEIATPAPRHLAPGYTDSTGRLIADCPSEPEKQLNPETLVLSYGEDSDLDVQPVNWKDFQEYLAKATGKKVVVQEYTNTVEDVLAIKDGKIHVVALHAADAPYLVNNAGLVPVAILGSQAGANGNHLDLAVKSTSVVKSLADVRNHTLTCTRPTSITGYRAAIAVLLRETKLRPDIEYIVNYSFGQRRSIQGLVGGDYELVALSDDKLQSMLKAGEINSSDYRLIYESQVIPRFAIGYVYNLEPSLAAKITNTILEFKNEHATHAESGEPMRFYAADYKKDFEFVRQIDESFDPRLGSNRSKANSDEQPTGL